MTAVTFVLRLHVEDSYVSSFGNDIGIGLYAALSW